MGGLMAGADTVGSSGQLWRVCEIWHDRSEEIDRLAGQQQVGPDCRGVYRTIYLAAKPEAIYVLHCFQKKIRKTARRDIEISRDRLKGVLKVW
jgi:hypothetical protein